MELSRRTTRVVAAVLSAPLVVLAAPAKAQTAGTDQDPAVITVDAGDPGPRISPLVLGANHRYEHSGYSMWDAQADRAAPRFVENFMAGGLTNTRFPGGTVANTYHWQRGIGPVAQRPRNISGGRGGEPITNEFGPDEWGRFAEQTGTTGSIVANFATGGATEAADWVEYMNAPLGTNPRGGTAWAQVRADNGHPEPYGVPYWEVGNELGFGNQAYWLGGLPEDQRAVAYAFGGSGTFSQQPAGRFDDHSAAAAVSDGSARQVFYAKYPPVQPDSQTVFVDGRPWREVSNLDSVGVEDVYRLDPETGKITFGDGTHGNVPPPGSVVAVSYVSGPHDGFVDFYQAMKAADPGIKVCSGFNPFRDGQQEAFLQAMGSRHPYDCIADHVYRNINDATSLADYHDRLMFQPTDGARQVRDLQKAARRHSGRDVEVVVTEYSIFSRKDIAPRYQHGLGGAIYTAESLNHWIRLGVPLAQRHALIDWLYTTDNPSGSVGYNAIFSAGPHFVPSPTVHAISLYRQLAGGRLADATVSNNPERELPDGRRLSALEVISAVDQAGNLVVIVINRDRESEVASRVVTQSHQGGTRARLRTLNGESLLAHNTPQLPDAVSVDETTIDVGPGGFSYIFPAHSVTAVTLSPAISG